MLIISQVAGDTDIFKPSSSRCASTTGCRVVEPITLGGGTQCVWGCVQFAMSDQSLAPMMIRAQMVSNMSYCTLPNSAFTNLVAVTPIIMSLQFPTTLYGMHSLNAATTAATYATWTPWVNMDKDWVAENGMDRMTCGLAVAWACLGQLRHYEDLTSAESRLYPTIVVPAIPGYYIDFPTTDPTAIFKRRHAFYTAYQRMITVGNQPGRVCPPNSTSVVEGVAVYAGTTPSGPVISFSTNLVIAVDDRRATFGGVCNTTLICDSWLGAHGPECQGITDATMCNNTPLCYPCTRPPTYPPTPFVHETLPPTAARPTVSDTLDFEPVIGVVSVVLFVILVGVVVVGIIGLRFVYTRGGASDESSMSLLAWQPQFGEA